MALNGIAERNGHIATADKAAPHSKAKPEEELKRLAVEIKDDLHASKVAAWERLRRYRSAGEGLRKAKQLLKEVHGSSYDLWTPWLKDNFALSDRQAQKYMALAKAPPKADLEAEEEQWNRVSGAASKRTKTGWTTAGLMRGRRQTGKVHPAKGGGASKLPDDDSWLITLNALPKKEANELRPLLKQLAVVLGTSDVTSTVLAALRFAHQTLMLP